MSNGFLQFTTVAGIERQHTVWNRPQQNGVAERANRTISEALTAMLAESGLPVSFWGEALASYVHMNSGMGLSLMCLTFESGDALLISMCKAIRATALDHTCRSASP